MNVSYTLSHYDRRHRIIGVPWTVPSRSFVKAFLQMVYCMMAELSQNIIDIDNTSRAISNSGDASLNVMHPGLSSKDLTSDAGFTGASVSLGTWPPQVFADEKGIVVGTSSAAVAVADDNLVAIIHNGTSAGQFVYYGCYGLSYTTGASSASFDVERIFRNSSGGSVTVAEIGMYSAGSPNGPGALDTDTYGFCLLRDVISPTVTVLNGEYLKVKYTITVSN